MSATKKHKAATTTETAQSRDAVAQHSVIREATLHDWDAEFGDRSTPARATDNSFARGMEHSRVSLLDVAATTHSIMIATGYTLPFPLAVGASPEYEPSSIDQMNGAMQTIHQAWAQNSMELLAGSSVPVAAAAHRGKVKHADIPVVWPDHHDQFLRRANSANPLGYVERKCGLAKDNSCEAAVIYGEPHAGLREYLSPEEEQCLIDSGGATYPARTPMCLLCIRHRESIIFFSRRAVSPGLQLTAGRRCEDLAEVAITDKTDQNKIVPINSEQVPTGCEGAYDANALLTARDSGGGVIGFCGGRVLAYKPKDYTVRLDGTISQDALKYGVRPPFWTSLNSTAGSSDGETRTRKPRDSLCPTSLLRRQLLSGKVLASALDTRAAHVLLCDSFIDTVHQVRQSLQRDVFVWDLPAAWLPPTWDAIRLGKCLSEPQSIVTSRSPILSTICSRLNWAYDYHGRLAGYIQSLDIAVAKQAMARELALDMTQAVRLFVNNHCAVVYLIEMHGVSSDRLFCEHVCGSLLDPAWEHLVPDDVAQIISDGLLPSTLDTVLYNMNLVTRSMSTKSRASPLDVIGKALPQPSARRTMATVIDKGCHDERFVRVMTYLLTCTLLGVYRTDSDQAMTDVRSQAAIWQLLTHAMRVDWTDFLTNNINQMLVLFACREFICDAVDNIPCVADVVYNRYNWDAYKTHAIEACRVIRSSLASHAYSRAQVQVPAVDQRVWSLLDAELAARHKDHTYDERVVKAGASSLIPKMGRASETYARAMTAALPAVTSVTCDVTTVCNHTWSTASSIVEQCAWFISANVSDMRKMGLRDYDTRVMLAISDDFQGGTMQTPATFLSLSPCGFEIVLAYLRAHKMASHSYVVPLGLRVANQQRLALARLNMRSPFLPLPENARCAWFCSRCQRLKSVVSAGMGRRSRSGLGIRGSFCLDEAAGDVPLCSTKLKDGMCAYPLRRLFLSGYSLKIGRASWTFCCGCGLLHKWDTAQSINGYPVCSPRCALHPELYLRDEERQRAWQAKLHALGVV